MEALVAGKPRVLYATVFAEKNIKLATVAGVVHRFIAKMDGTDGRPPVRPLGLSHRLTLLRVCREILGPVPAAELTKQQVIAYIESMTDLCAATRMQYITYLGSALRYYGSAWDEKVSDKAIKDAKPFLKTHGLIGKSTPRDRRPTQEELERLFDLFVDQNSRPKNKIDMVLIALWQIASGRRIGETCKLLWGDWNKDAHTILVRKMKDPRGKKQKVVALTDEAQRMLEALEHMRLTPDDPAERIFPFNEHSVSAKYTAAKKLLGIVNLRLHDSRRETISRLAEKGYTSNQIRLVSGHETNAVLDRTYNKANPATFKDLRLAA